jgi:hypothetical protein
MNDLFTSMVKVSPSQPTQQRGNLSLPFVALSGFEMRILGENNLRVQHGGVIEVAKNEQEQDQEQQSAMFLELVQELRKHPKPTGCVHESTGIHHKLEQVSVAIETPITS